MTRLTLVRHGQTDWNVAGRVQGSSDIDLNETGRQQARDARDSVWSELRDGAVVVSSHLSRAVETAQILCEGRDVRLETDPRIAERAYGEWEGLAADQRAIDFPEDFALWQAGHEPRIKGYETHATLAARVREAALEWAERVGPEGEMLMVSHGSAGRMLLLELLGLPLTGRLLGHMNNTAWSRISLGADGRWSLDRHNVLAPVVTSGGQVFP